ncbi:HET-domain-containing protein [Lepidopterella palustris CBS 459.81]|uniref:HET-domain-containing protein n=1 Tax=Lepidopterella palustris CBS 459.81 TaxID=1314670 RepID=A0A8E2JB49_9PEZI|nr:HET-domain-containing protein [Lepidopterella palustris CBS 459.81]
MAKKCEACRNLDSNDVVYSSEWTTGRVFQDNYLHASDAIRKSREGCPICSLILNILDLFLPDWRLKQEKLRLDVLAPDNRPFEVRVNEVPEEPNALLRELVNVQFSIANKDSIPELPNLGTSRILERNAGNANCLRFIQDRISQCTSKHHLSHSAVEAALPKRVIDLGRDNDSLRLHETENSKGFYAALSYCWGPANALIKSTSATLDIFKREIPWCQLPKTLQDAIHITRKLKLRYIWIDCLCIIQDSRKDWETEAEKMGSYYKNAFITVAASSSKTAQSGIFTERSAVSEPKETQFTSKSGVNYPIIAQARPARLWPSPVHDLGPLTERGWTFQEHALSRRMIHFLESEIVWECSSEMISEDGHQIRDDTYSLIREFTHFRSSPEDAWRLCIRAYSDRALSNLSDKLPAISGIASHFQEQKGHNYIVGMWRETLAVDIVWSSWGWVELNNPPQMLQAPSWSWASIHGGVAFAMETINQTTTPITVHCTILGFLGDTPETNRFGEVRYGMLEVSGPLQEAELEYAGELNDFGIPKFRLTALDQGQHLTFFVDTSLAQVDARDLNGLATKVISRKSAPIVPFRGKVWCLWCFTAEQEASDTQEWFGIEPMRLNGIVLGESPENPGIYRRVGSVCTSEHTVPSTVPTKIIRIE